MRNSDAVTLVPPALPVVTQSGGEPARSGAAKNGDDGNREKLRNNPFKRVPESLWTIEKLPGCREGTVEVEAAPATLSRTGAEDDDTGKTA